MLDDIVHLNCHTVLAQGSKTVFDGLLIGCMLGQSGLDRNRQARLQVTLPQARTEHTVNGVYVSQV